MDTIVKKEFVRRILEDEASRFEKNQGLAMRKILTFHTGQTESSRIFKVETADNFDGKLTMKHLARQRFLDIKRKKRSRKSRRLRTTQYPIHNRFVFGHFYSIANRLMVDFTNEVAEGIKRDLKLP
ncbi:hypothetical protein [Algoriphagus marincola]|uniref:hypothetical protein n=1 Tax=Algoriphagus marincola TaxID=264027 RepID=UPI0003FA9537|nr:hypothetical protein [Algoriphagus marincola]